MPNDLTPNGRTTDPRSLYERDYYTWALEQARALKEHRLEELDWENLADEVEGLVKCCGALETRGDPSVD
jgi:hypothetical protein